MIVVTGGLGFIGSNLIRKLNQLSIKNILVIENKKTLIDKYSLSLQFEEIIYINNNLEKILKILEQKKIECIFHQGAIVNTTNENFEEIKFNNIDFTIKLLNFCLYKNIKFINASSASIYGDGTKGFFDNSCNYTTLNLYAFSKIVIDQYISFLIKNNKANLLSFRYFNVFGPGEEHKKDMSSAIFHFINNSIKYGKFYLFEGTEGYKNGTQSRDFIYIDDVINNLIFFWKKNIKGIYNLGTGQNLSFNHIARVICNVSKNKFNLDTTYDYKPMPNNLKKKYQNFTKAEMINFQKKRKYNFQNFEISIEKYFNYFLEK